MVPQPRYINLEYLYNFLLSVFGFGVSWFTDFAYWVERHDFRIFSLLVSAVFVVGIFYTLRMVMKVKRKKLADFVNIYEIESVPENRSVRWKEIKTHMSSESSAEWKIAILEADGLLDEILIKIGYQGENMGERLKGIEPSDFDNLQNIWDAHKARNRIAHEPGIVIMKSEAEEILEKYEKALKELKYL